MHQLGGNGEQVIYSDGKFESLKMKETSLNEVVKFPIQDLDFLSKHPYYFKLTKLSEHETSVDWNRNGIAGEKGVRADINDGYSVAIRDSTRGDRSAGAPSLAAIGESVGLGCGVIFFRMMSANRKRETQGAAVAVDAR